MVIGAPTIYCRCHFSLLSLRQSFFIGAKNECRPCHKQRSLRDTSAPISRKLHRLFLSKELYHESFRTCKVCLFKKYHYLCVLPIAIFILIYTYNENSETLAGHDSSAMVNMMVSAHDLEVDGITESHHCR